MQSGSLHIGAAFRARRRHTSRDNSSVDRYRRPIWWQGSYLGNSDCRALCMVYCHLKKYRLCPSWSAVPNRCASPASNKHTASNSYQMSDETSKIVKKYSNLSNILVSFCCRTCANWHFFVHKGPLRSCLPCNYMHIVGTRWQALLLKLIDAHPIPGTRTLPSTLLLGHTISRITHFMKEATPWTVLYFWGSSLFVGWVIQSPRCFFKAAFSYFIWYCNVYKVNVYAALPLAEYWEYSGPSWSQKDTL